MSIGIEEREAVLRVMDRAMENSSTLSGYVGNWSSGFYGGEEIKALESEWAEYFGVKYAIACNSATSGLWMACAAIGLQQNFTNIKCEQYSCGGYEPAQVIVSPYSMTCSASIPLHFGAKPVFADIEEDYYCLDVKSIEERITEHTKAIIVVDIFGQPYDADAINKLAERKGKEYGHKIYVIEDAAQAAGAEYKGKYAGTLGDIGVFSLNVHKPIQCGEGGIVVTNDDELAMRLRLCLNHSEAVINDIHSPGHENIRNTIEEWKMLKSLVGMNLRMAEISAAIAREQLKKLDGIIKIQQKYAKCFDVKIRPECEHSFYRYAVSNMNLTDGINELTAPILTGFYNDRKGNPNGAAFGQVHYNIKRHYIKPLYQMPLFKQLGYDQHSCPVCEETEKNIVLAWLKEPI